MINHCPECGTRLEKDYKFCPNCGFDLRELNKNFGKAKEDAGIKTISGEVIICDVCGDENDLANEVCAGCGAKLDEKNIVRKDRVVKESTPPVSKPKPKQQKPLEQKKTKSGVKNKKPERTTTEPVKKLDAGKFASLVVIIVGAVIIILFLSGVFDTTSIPEGNFSGNQFNQNQQPTVNLNNVQEINNLRSRVESNPEDHEALLQLAHLLNDSGMYDNAIERYKQYLETHPDNSDARVDMGVCYYNLGEYENAIAQMEKALEYSPNHQIAHLNLGIVNLAAGNLEKSKEWLQKAVQINPNNDVGQRAQELLKSHQN